MNTKFIKHNGKDIEIPNSLDELTNLLSLQKIKFESIKRDNFKDNSILIKLLDSYFQNEYANGNFQLPEMNTMGNESIAIFSDYGGEHKGSKYNSYSFLFCSWNHTYPIVNDLKKIRNKFNLVKKEISFKSLSHGPTSRVLDDYLNTLNKDVHGFLLTVLIEKNISPLFVGKENEYLLQEIENMGLGRWHRNTAEKLMRIMHLIGYILPLIANSSAKIIWMSDKDPVIQNNEMFENALKILPKVLKIYSNNEYKNLGGAQLPFDNKDIYTMDLLSITDLVAGSVEQYFTEEQKNGKAFVKKDANKIIKWLATSSPFLKKEVVRLSKDGKFLTLDGIKFNKE